jgi:UDP-glucose:(glucosyl)LPS alpha-1,2-glucosyltransferase|tara:strand:- start:1654 stop:2580 length:927 start_codon:yes stop_codon:yes gene_type:complete
MKPKGATEIQYELLEKHVPKELLSKFQICTSIPGKIPLDPNKINILWQKNSWDQPNLQSFFRNKNRHHEYDWYVFNSHWNYEKFRYFFQLPEDKCIVIKNGASHFPERKIYKKGDPIKIIHHCTPWRGLNVLLLAMQYVQNKNVTLDVYSSNKIYGSEFATKADKDTEDLFKQAEKLPNVNYIGYKPNEYILKHMSDYNLFVYPSIFEETFCASALEALAAGIHVITTNFGALPETCAEWPVYVNYTKNFELLAASIAGAIDISSQYLHTDTIQNHLNEQQKYYKKFYSWDKKAVEWENFLKGALRVK